MARSVPPADTSATPLSPPSEPVALQALSANTLGAWAGGSFSTGDLIGNIQRAQMGLVGLRYHRLLIPSPSKTKTGGPTLTYTVDMFPVLLLSIPPNTVAPPPARKEPGPEASSVYQEGMDTYGFGVSPAGLRLTSRIAKRVQPFVAGSTGLSYFSQPIPNGLGRHLNFMFGVGAGVQIVLTSDLILTAGYRYYHLSNGFRGQINPGIDANLLHLGVAMSQ